MLRDFLIALSLANLCFIRVWPEMLNDFAANPYYLKTPLSTTDVGLLILTILLLAVVMWVGVVLARYSRRAYILTFARWIFLLTLTVPLNGLRVKLPFPLSISLSTAVGKLGQIGAVLLIVALFIASAFTLVRWYRSIIRGAANIVLIMSPFILYTFSQAVWPLVKHAGSNIVDKPLAPTLPTPQSQPPRILWLVFDEMDQHVAFEGRPAIVKLPELDRFRMEAIYVSKVRSPANMTNESMPALITGKLVSKADPVSANELMITFQDAPHAVPWSLVRNVFSKARGVGVNSALVGWYHPYCRIIGSSLTSCSWQPAATKYGIRSGRTWFARMVWIPTLIRTIPFARRLRFQERLESRLGIRLPERKGYADVTVPRYRRILRDAVNVTTNPALGLILVHWPIPHPPGIYNRLTSDFAYDGTGNYLDNLELVDRTLGELRQRLEKARLWDDYIVLLTSDHPYRTSTWKWKWHTEEASGLKGEQVGQYVPFLLKLPGQKKSITYDRSLNSVVIADLLMAFLHGKLTGPESVVDWFDQRRANRGH